VVFVDAGGVVLVELDVHRGEGLGDLGGVVRGGPGRVDAFALGEGGHIALEVVAARQVPGSIAVEALVSDVGVGAEVGAGEVAEVEVAVGGRGRREHELRSARRVGAGGGPR